MLFFFFLSFISFSFIPVEVGGGGVDFKGGGEGRCSGESGAGGDYCSHWLEPEGVVLLSPCDAYQMFLICT